MLPFFLFFLSPSLLFLSLFQSGQSILHGSVTKEDPTTKDEMLLHAKQIFDMSDENHLDAVRQVL